MRSNRGLKSQDVLVLAKLVTDELWPSQMDVARTFEISQSEVSHSFRTLERLGLVNLNQRKINKLAVIEFFIHAVKYFFPSEQRGMDRGTKIGPSSLYFNQKVHPGDFHYIWPDADGEHKGIAVIPLIPQLPSAVKENEKLFYFINIIEIFRGLGGVRHLKEAEKALREILV